MTHALFSRVSLPLLCAFALVGHAHDAGAKRPVPTEAPTPSAVPAPKTTKAAKTQNPTQTVAAKITALVSEQRIAVPCYALVPFDNDDAKNWRRAWQHCYATKPNMEVTLASPLQFPAVKGHIYLRKLECDTSVQDNTEMKLEVHVQQASTGGISTTLKKSDKNLVVHEFDNVKVDPKKRYDLLVVIKTKTTPGGDPDDYKGRIGDCFLDYMIIG